MLLKFWWLDYEVDFGWYMNLIGFIVFMNFIGWLELGDKFSKWYFVMWGE